MWKSGKRIHSTTRARIRVIPNANYPETMTAFQNDDALVGNDIGFQNQTPTSYVLDQTQNTMKSCPASRPWYKNRRIEQFPPRNFATKELMV